MYVYYCRRSPSVWGSTGCLWTAPWRRPRTSPSLRKNDVFWQMFGSFLVAIAPTRGNNRVRAVYPADSAGASIFLWQKQCSWLSLNRKPCPPDERGGGRRFSPRHQSCDRERDGQHGHIISAGRDSHLLAGLSYIACKFNTIILWQGKTNKVKFLFFRQHNSEHWRETRRWPGGVYSFADFEDITHPFLLGLS